MHPAKALVGFILLFLCTTIPVGAQKVGVVLSGGGATAMAHVGFLRALEEEGIPIDYVCGTSMGAIVGAFYAAGYSIAEMDSMVRSPEFAQMAGGIIDEQLQFYYKEDDPDAHMVNIKYGRGSFISQNLPTNLIDPVLFDYKLMELLSEASAGANYNFDSLFVPFRCVASDIENKKLVPFERGNLNVATRASATYPFYLTPIRVDGKLMYDGGLYDNFPSRLLYETFLPDVILGCNVSEVMSGPDEEDIFSQLESMIRSKSNFEKICDAMVIVEPVSNVGTFDFDNTWQAVTDGYTATQDRMDEIREVVSRRALPEEVQARRDVFRSTLPPLVVSDIRITGLDRAQRNYVRKVMGGVDSLSREELKPVYFRVFADDKIRSIFPTTMYDSKEDQYVLNLDVKREKDLFLSFGGNFSSRPINTGFVGLRYNLFGNVSAKLAANSYFGKYYGSVNGRVELDISGRIPFRIEPGFTFNRWDYFTSFATFFEEVRPSFIVLNERFAGLKLTFPQGNKGRLILESNYGFLRDDYYQIEAFSQADTADRTAFDHLVVETRYERNTLNRKQWASKGSHLWLKGKYVVGEERSIPGSTSAIRDTTVLEHEWFSLRGHMTHYFFPERRLRFGFQLEGLASLQDIFQNYVATVVTAPVFRPIPESQTFFLEQFHAHNYLSAGAMAVMELGSIDLRAEGYVFNAFGRIVSDGEDRAQYDWDVRPYWILSSSAVLHTPIGPLSFSVNYYENKGTRFSYVLNFGYIIFNDSVRD